MIRRAERLQRIKAVHREFQMAEIAVNLLRDRLRSQPDMRLPADLSPRDAEQLRENLEATFLIRLFAEFEAGLREAWAAAFHRSTQPPASDLIAAIGTIQLIPGDVQNAAHAVRLARNVAVHGDRIQPVDLSLEDARTALCRYFARLPLTW